MKGIVWGLTSGEAQKKLEKIEEQYQKYQTAQLLKKRRDELIFSNGDHWIACRASESARGRKCNISYIDARIDKDIIDFIIRPCTTLGPYIGFHYYYDFVT